MKDEKRISIHDTVKPPAMGAAETSLRVRTPIAVIEIGTATIRLAIAQVKPDGSVRPLDTLLQAVAIGRDTFTHGEISRETTEQCVKVLASYRKVISEFGILNDGQVRTVATSAVREAVNRDAFIDRIFMATGLVVEPFEETDIIRMTYLGLYSQLTGDSALNAGEVVVAAMEGGSTDVFYFKRGKVTLARNYRLGTIRLQRMLETFRTPLKRRRELMENHVRLVVEAICKAIPSGRGVQVLAVGSEARFAAVRIDKDWDLESPTRLSVTAYGRLAARIGDFSTEQVAKEFGLPLVESETLAPALYFHLSLARFLHARYITVSGRSMRSGILLETARKDLWLTTLGDQVVEPAREIARKYGVNESHAEHVAALSRQLFAALMPEHKLGPWHELLLIVAAILHDTGLYISERHHHKHSMYIINNSNLFGISEQDRLLVALIARYHRGAGPKPVHEGFATLIREKRALVLKLAAILRTADALDASHSQRVKKLYCYRESGRLVLEVPGLLDLSLETLALRGKGSMFQDVYGIEPVLRGKMQGVE